MTRLAGTIFLLCALVLGACGRNELSPEEQVRAMITAAELEAQAKDLVALKARIAEDYSDRFGRDRVELLGFLRLHFLRNERIHLLVRVAEIEVDPKGRARANVLVGTAGRPIPALEALAEAAADLLWVDLEFALREGQWTVTSADWQRARLEDLL